MSCFCCSACRVRATKWVLVGIKQSRMRYSQQKPPVHLKRAPQAAPESASPLPFITPLPREARPSLLQILATCNPAPFLQPVMLAERWFTGTFLTRAKHSAQVGHVTKAWGLGVMLECLMTVSHVHAAQSTEIAYGFLYPCPTSIEHQEP